MTRPGRRPVPDLRPWIASWGAEWSVPDLARRTSVAFSGRMSRSLGRCTLRTGEIRLNAALLDGPEAALLEVACHEAAHAAVFILHGAQARPHGREWKALMRRAGYEPVVRWPEHRVPDEVKPIRRRVRSSRKAPLWLRLLRLA